MSTDAPQTIVLIHRLWLTPRSWEGWKERFDYAVDLATRNAAVPAAARGAQ